MALASLRPLRSRNFALIWSAALVSNIGTWMQTVALGILVFARTGQPAWTGLVAAAGFLPIGLLAPLGGALADRFDRRRWLIATTLAEMSFAAMLALLAAVGDDRPAVLVLFSFLGARPGPSDSPLIRPWSPTWSRPTTSWAPCRCRRPNSIWAAWWDPPSPGWRC